jgi:formylglycine-generating enzyme required for sulfatase activity
MNFKEISIAKYILLLLISLNLLAVPTLNEINEEMELIANEYNIPSPILKALAFKQSRWNVNYGNDDDMNKGVYGIMGLYQSNKVSSIYYGSKLLNIDPIYAITEYKWNIEISAKIISDIKSDYVKSGNTIEEIEDYFNIIVDYLDFETGLEAYAIGYVIDLYKTINEGYDVTYNEERLKVQPYKINISNIRIDDISKFYKTYTDISSLEDIEFITSPNYSERSANIDQIIIHIMQGTLEGSISWFKNTSSNVSAHYLVGQNGEIVQMVRLTKKAWHAGTHNSRSIGIEHAGFDDGPAGYTDKYITEAEYQASAKLTKWLCEKYGIPKVHRDAYHDENGNFTPWTLKRPALANESGILGHHDCNGKKYCPGPNWDWAKYMQLVGGTTEENNNPTGGGDNDGTLDEACLNDETPAKRVRLSDYKIGKYEVTVEQYKQCVDAAVCAAPTSGNYTQEGRDKHPINSISWYDAQRFCSWLGGSDGKVRLPTEAEWEHAAKGDSNNLYVWGEDEPTCDKTVMESEDGVDGCGESSTAEVGSKTLDKSEFGVMDMAGNISEYTNDYYDPAYYNSGDSVINPKGPKKPVSNSIYITVRGAEWHVHKKSSFRNSRRLAMLASVKSDSIGFRCAYKDEGVSNNTSGNTSGETGNTGGETGETVTGTDCTPDKIVLQELNTPALPFLYTDSKDTNNAPNDCFDKYPDNATKEYGKEYIYHFKTTKKVNAKFYIKTPEPNSTDIDLQLFKTLSINSPGLIQRNDKEIEVTLEPGEYYLSLDSYGAEGATYEGAYHLTIDLKENIPIASTGKLLNPYMINAANYMNSNYHKKGYDLNSNYTHDLYYKGRGTSSIVAMTGPVNPVTGGQTYTQCIGAVHEALLISMKEYYDETSDPKTYSTYTPAKWFGAMQAVLYQHDGVISKGITTHIKNYKMGRVLSSLSEATPGTAIHIDRDVCNGSGGGHSVVFVSFIDKYGNEYTTYPTSKEVVGFKYISANGSGYKQTTKGVYPKYAILKKYLKKSGTSCTYKPNLSSLVTFCSSHECDTWKGGAVTLYLGDYYIPSEWNK